MNGYNLIRAWYNYKFENPQKVKAKHSDFYCYLVDQWNRLGQKKQFGLPTSYTMECLGIGSYNTYKSVLNDLVEFGFVKIVSDSKNQHQSKIVALSNFDKATDKALDKATAKATDKALDTITKQGTKNKEPIDVDFDKLVQIINKYTGRKFQFINDDVKGKYIALFKKGYTKENLITAIKNASKSDFHKSENNKYLTPEFFSRSSTIDKYSYIPESELPPIPKEVANVAVQIPEQMQILLDRGYTEQQIKDFAK